MDANLEKFKELMDVLQIHDILLVHIESDSFEKAPANASKIKIEYKLQYIGDMIINTEEKIVSYQVKALINLYDTTEIDKDECPIMKIVLGYILSFSCVDISRCTTLLSDETVKDLFIKVQIPKTLWPFLRQQYYDLANRHSLHVPPLPWIK
jgi:hypothetical protein